MHPAAKDGHKRKPASAGFRLSNPLQKELLCPTKP